MSAQGGGFGPPPGGGGFGPPPGGGGGFGPPQGGGGGGFGPPQGGGGGFGPPQGGGGGFGPPGGGQTPPPGGGFGPPGGGQTPPPGGAGFGPPQGAPPGGGFGGPPIAGPPPGGGGGQNDQMAIASIALGAVSFLFSCCCGCISWPAGIGAIITGILAVQNINKDPSKGGKNLAIAGIALGSIAFVIAVILTIINIMSGTYDQMMRQYG
jgi:Domain of unknown function (DUF4190)